MTDQYELSITKLAATVKGAWLRLLIFSGLIAFGTMIILNFVSPRFFSEARILVTPSGVYQKPVAGSKSTEGQGGLDQSAIVSQVHVIQSRDLISKVIEKEKLEQDPVFNKKIKNNPEPAIIREKAIDSLLKNLTVVSLSSSRVVGIQYSSTDPILAAKIANALSKVYIEWQRSESVQQNQDDTVRLARLIEDLKKEVKASEAAVADYRVKKGIYKSTRENVTLSSQQLTQLNSRIIAARELRAESEIRASLLRKTFMTKGEVSNTSVAGNAQSTQRLFAQKNTIKGNIAELSATLLPSHPRIKQLRAQLNNIDSQIRTEMERIVLAAESDAKIARAREDSLTKSLNELKNLSARTDGDEIQLRALEREARTNRDLLNTYLARFRDAEARGDSAVAPAYATIISKAHVPIEPYFPKIIPMSILAGFVTLLLGVAFLMMREILGTGTGPMPARVPKREGNL